MELFITHTLPSSNPHYLYY